jgi:flagellar biosynthetic protein FliR
MGFGMVNVLDPQTGGQMPIIGQLYYLTAIWLFLLVNGHHILLNVLAQSFKILPVGKLFYFTKGLPLIIKNFSQLFWLALQVAIPIIGVLFLTDVGLGVLSKLIPQINVFILGFPIKVFLGITLLILSLPVLLRWLAVNYSNTGSIWTELLRFIKLIGQGE